MARLALVGGSVVLAASLAGCSGGASTPPTGMVGSTSSTGASQVSSAAGPASSSQTAQPSTAAVPAVTESNPPGDIPDSQVFVRFTPPGTAVSVKIPEGWARSSKAAGATTTTSFTDKLNMVEISVTRPAGQPSVGSVLTMDVPTLTRSESKFVLGRVTTAHLAAWPAILLTYQRDSAPNPVTAKVVRDAVERFTVFRAGTRVDLVLSGPVNADNVDPWRIVSTSLVWR